MILRVKVSPEIQTTYLTMHRFFHAEADNILQRILALTNNSN
jgi:hypothetical protein